MRPAKAAAAGVIGLLLLTTGLVSAPQTNRDCKVTFQVTGDRADGNGTWTTRLTVTERCYDFTPDRLPALQKDADAKYGGYDYEQVGGPSQRQDCAGYVFQHLTNYPDRYWITASELYNTIVPWFAARISSTVAPWAWGGVAPGDLVFYGRGGSIHHVAIVTDVDRTLGVVHGVTIATKDNEEAVYGHRLSLNEMTETTTDPLVRAYGPVRIYRVKKDNLKWTEVERTCRCGAAPAALHGWKLVEVVSDPDHYLSEEKLGPGQLMISGTSAAVRVKGNLITFVFPDPPDFIPDDQTVTVVVSGQLSGNADRAYASYDMNALGGLNQETLPDASGATSTTVGIDSYAPFRTDRVKLTHRLWGEKYQPGTTATLSARILVGNVSFGVYQAKYVRQ